jgi:VanZ family protein
MILSRPLLHAARIAAGVLFWPALLLVVWGELAAAPAQGVFAWIAIVNDKVLHFIAYFGLAAMAGFAVRRRSGEVLAVAGLILLGLVLEIVQGFVGRDMSGPDALANTFGAICGGFLAQAAAGYLRRTHPSG